MFCRFASTSTLPPTIRQLLSQHNGTSANNVQVNGWVKSIRRQKNVSFAVITDGSSGHGLQAVFANGELTKSLTNGCCVQLNGKLVDSPGAGQSKELQVHGLELLGSCHPEEYPIQKQSLPVEFLREHLHLRPRTENTSAMLRLRASSQTAIRQFFEAEGFCYAHTPLLTVNDCEGAGEAFRIAPLSSHSETTAQEFFQHPSYLTVSSQLHLEALAASISRVYTLSPCFRAERSQTNRHLAEFWMLEAEWAFTKSIGDICSVAEECLKHVLRDPAVLQERDVLWKGGDDAKRLLLENCATDSAWTRMTYTEAIAELVKFHQKTPFTFKPIWGRALQSEHERFLASTLVKGPVFVTSYPTELKPFYMRLDPDPRTVACFDLLVPHVGELAGGSLREERLPLLEQGLDRCGLDRRELGWYTDLRKYGGAPHGGFGLGFERFIGWIGGIENVRECIAMPRWAGRLDL